MDRTERFGLNLSPDEKRVLRQLAEVDGGASQAATLRRLLRREARERGLWPPRQKAVRQEIAMRG
jgi:hypothetical protein